MVGIASNASDVTEAFIWDENHGMRELDEVLTALGADLRGWTLDEVGGISADGRTIVGSGVTPEGNLVGWMAVIPEPGTALLLGLGLGVLATRRPGPCKTS